MWGNTEMKKRRQVTKVLSLHRNSKFWNYSGSPLFLGLLRLANAKKCNQLPIKMTKTFVILHHFNGNVFLNFLNYLGLVGKLK